jgi:hypothetical protein
LIAAILTGMTGSEGADTGISETGAVFCWMNVDDDVFLSS